MKIFKRAQRRIRGKLKEKKAAIPGYKPPKPKKVVDPVPGQVDANGEPLLDNVGGPSREGDDGSPPPPVVQKLDKNEVLTKLKKLDKQLRAPVETVLQVGWSGIAWPSNFTAAHLAATHGSLDALEILANAKADFGVEDDWGRTALDYARQHHRRAAENLIEGQLRYAGHEAEPTPIVEGNSIRPAESFNAAPSNAASNTLALPDASPRFGNAPSAASAGGTEVVGSSSQSTSSPNTRAKGRPKVRGRSEHAIDTGVPRPKQRRQKAFTDGGAGEENPLSNAQAKKGRKPRKSPQSNDLGEPQIQMF
jgi:hypothetical protein